MKRRDSIINGAVKKLRNGQGEFFQSLVKDKRVSKKAIRRAAIESALEQAIVQNKRKVRFSRKEARKASKAFADLFAQKEHFNGKKGFTSLELAFSHKPKTSKRRRGVDEALYSMMIAGVGKRQMVQLVDFLLAIPAKRFRVLELNRDNYGTFAAQLYHEILPQIIHLLPKRFKTNLGMNDLFAHNLIFILALGFQSEIGRRAQQKHKPKLPPGFPYIPKKDKMNRYRQRLKDKP